MTLLSNHALERAMMCGWFCAAGAGKQCAPARRPGGIVRPLNFIR